MLQLPIMILEELKNIKSDLKTWGNKANLYLEDTFNKLETEEMTAANIDNVEEVLKFLMQNAKEYTKEEDKNWMYQSFEKGQTLLKKIILDPDKLPELREKSFEILIKILPLYFGFTIKKPKFPSNEYSSLMLIILTNQGDYSLLIKVLNKYMIYEDMRNNFWKALDEASTKIKLETDQVRNILQIIATLASKNEKPKQDGIGPVQLFCGVKVGVLTNKEIGKHVQRIWERLSSVEVSSDTRQLLLHTLLERMIFRIDKPIFLTDYFMSSLEFGGPTSILALQGIFTLIQKHNINYPNIYDKLYEMLDSSIFGVHYKTRLFFLLDVFLSSLHLPEALVAGFAKRLARLCLVAPPADILVLLALITNLLIRHSGLYQLVTNLGKQHYESDPFVSTEKDPSASKALESSLWELKLLQQHVLPRVSAAAMFIENPLPSVECDLSELLECDSNQIFSSEIKRKMKDPPLSFEHPSMLSVEKGFTFWDFEN